MSPRGRAVCELTAAALAVLLYLPLTDARREALIARHRLLGDSGSVAEGRSQCAGGMMS